MLRELGRIRTSTKTSLFADEITLTVGQAITLLPVIIKEIGDFGKLLGFKMNMTKS